MPESSLILVLDTNTVLRGFIHAAGASGRLLSLCKQRRVITLLSKPILSEYREIIGDPSRIGGAFHVREALHDLLDALYFMADYIDPVKPRFDFGRDPDDAMFIELAIAGHATHIISHDKDLLSLPTSRTDAGKRFRQRLPGVRIIDAATFLREQPHLET